MRDYGRDLYRRCYHLGGQPRRHRGGGGYGTRQCRGARRRERLVCEDLRSSRKRVGEYERTAVAIQCVYSSGPMTSRRSRSVASMSARRAACTEAKLGGTGKEVGPSVVKDRGGKPCALMQSLIVFEESAMRAVRPSRVRSVAGSILSEGERLKMVLDFSNVD